MTKLSSLTALIWFYYSNHSSFGFVYTMTLEAGPGWRQYLYTCCGDYRHPPLSKKWKLLRIYIIVFLDPYPTYSSSNYFSVGKEGEHKQAHDQNQCCGSRFDSGSGFVIRIQNSVLKQTWLPRSWRGGVGPCRPRVRPTLHHLLWWGERFGGPCRRYGAPTARGGALRHFLWWQRSGPSEGNSHLRYTRGGGGGIFNNTKAVLLNRSETGAVI
jgi:hypothetical protein